jgi:O-antigen/teichoic acid export membrane protein
MKYWFSRFSGAVVLSIIASVATFIAGVFVLRVLNPASAGRFSLITSAAGMVGLLGLFGQHSMINRAYARNQISYYWQRDLANTILFSSVIIVFATALMAISYSFTAGETIFIAAIALLTVFIYAGAFMLNSHRHYVWSTLLLRLPNALFIIPVALAMIGLMKADVTGFLISQVIIGFACSMIGLAGLSINMPAGTIPIPLEERKEAVGLFLLLATHLFIDPGMIVMAGYFVAPDQLAAFAGLMNLLRPFILIWSILLQTLSVEFGRNHQFPKRRLLLGMWALALPLFLVTWTAAPAVMDFLYSSKYNFVNPAALPISLLGALLITETVPRSFIAGAADDRDLRRYIRDQMLSALICAAAGIVLINQFGVFGAAWTGFVLMLMRNWIAYAYLFRRAGGLKTLHKALQSAWRLLSS